MKYRFVLNTTIYVLIFGLSICVVINPIFEHENFISSIDFTVENEMENKPIEEESQLDDDELFFNDNRYINNTTVSSKSSYKKIIIPESPHIKHPLPPPEKS